MSEERSRVTKDCLEAIFVCARSFRNVQLGANFTSDYATSAAELKACNIHLLRWGMAVMTVDSLSESPSEGLMVKEACNLLKEIVRIHESRGKGEGERLPSRLRRMKRFS